MGCLRENRNEMRFPWEMKGWESRASFCRSELLTRKGRFVALCVKRQVEVSAGEES